MAELDLIHSGARVPVTPQTREQHRDALANVYQRQGGMLLDAPTGPVLERFAPNELALVLHNVAHESKLQGLTKVRVDMTCEDAVQLAAYLRRAVLAGV